MAKRKNSDRREKPAPRAPSQTIREVGNSGHDTAQPANPAGFLAGIAPPATPDDADEQVAKTGTIRFEGFATNRISLARRAGLRAGLVRESMADRIGVWIDREVETGLLFNLLPLFLAFGVWLYFAAPQEPSMPAVLFAMVAFIFLALRQQRHGFAFLLFAALAGVLCGMASGKWSVLRNYTPMLERQVTGTVGGTVVMVDQNRRGSERMIIRPLEIEGIEQDRLPDYVRLSAANGAGNVRPGDWISGLARLQPVSGPAFPGSYDFSFHAWFEGLGASGFLMGAPQVSSDGPRTLPGNHLAPRDRFAIAINQLRTAVEERIRQALPARTAGVVIALITGNKTGIEESAQEALRATGLAHILAISGLHMALVTLTLIWVIRLAMSAFPALALRYPVKKWAVVAGFVSASFYLALSGAGIATQRAWITISVMLLAVLLDRRAITMRSVAVSATIILVISPQSLFAPGFQMSFAAVAALVAGYEAINRWRSARLARVPDRNLFFRMGRNSFTYLAGLALTSLIAGTATSFIAAWHFHQAAPLGLVANLLAMPLVSLIVMPMVMVSLLLMPFGYEVAGLYATAWGVEQVLAIAGWVSSLTEIGVTGILPAASLGVFGCFLAILTLFRTPLRLLAVLPVAAYLPFAGIPQVPDILVSEDGRSIGILEQGELKLAYPRSGRFITEIWAKAFAGGKPEKLDTKGECTRERCIVELPSGHKLHLVYNPDLLQASCQRADILLAPRLWWINCRERQPQLILKRHDFEQYGSHVLFLPQMPKETIRVKRALPVSNRPWSRDVPPK